MSRRGPRAAAPHGNAAQAPAVGVRGFGDGVILGVVALLVIEAMLGLVAFLLLRPDGLEAEVARLRAQDAARDREQIEALTEQARSTVAEVSPILDEMAAVLPAPGEQRGDPPVELADVGTADRWVAGLSEAAAAYEDPPSGQTATNVARGALSAGVELLVEAAATHRLALDAPAADRDAGLIARAAAARDLGIRTWAVGATQLDAINVDAGNGHQHAYLSGSGGAFSPDGAADGEGATGG